MHPGSALGVARDVMEVLLEYLGSDLLEMTGLLWREAVLPAVNHID
jgi:hypothetical protein